MVSEIGPRRWMGEQGAAAVVAAEGLPTMRGLNDCYRLAESRKEYLDGGAWLFHGRTVLFQAPGFRNIYRSIFCTYNWLTHIWSSYGVIRTRTDVRNEFHI
jgi:hypothetical protein